MYSDHVKQLFERPDADTDSADKVLTLSGGGTGAGCFSMGAVGYLVKHGLFDQYDTINAVSGSTMLVALLEPCYAFKYTSEPDWYNKYIRSVVYAVMKQRIMAKMLIKFMNPMNWFRTGTHVAGELFAPLFAAELKPYTKDMETYTGKSFRSNYIDMDDWHLSYDNTDLYNPVTGDAVSFFWIKRIFRCCVPFTYINRKPTMDAVFVDNMALASVLGELQFSEMLSVSTVTDYVQDPVPRPPVTSIWQFLKRLLNITEWTTAPPNRNNIHMSVTMCKMLRRAGKSIQLAYPRQNSKWYSKPSIIMSKWYNGMLFLDEPIMRLIENMGYFEMHRTLTGRDDLPDSEHPNPDYPLSGDVAKAHFERYDSRSTLTYVAIEILEVGVRPLLQSLMFWKSS